MSNVWSPVTSLEIASREMIELVLSKVALLFVASLTGCSDGPGFLDGVGFEVNDAVFERKMLFDGAKQVTMILASDAGDLCDRVSTGRSLAGHAELAIKSWESGTVQVELRRYSDDCEVETTELASQGWVDNQSTDPYRADFDVVFRTQARSVSGRLAADFCALPDSARIGCE